VGIAGVVVVVVVVVAGGLVDSHRSQLEAAMRAAGVVAAVVEPAQPCAARVGKSGGCRLVIRSPSLRVLAGCRC
jgi:hypothetical protein